MTNVKRVLRYLLLIAVAVALLRVSIFSLRFFLECESPLAVVDGPSMEPTYYDGDLLVVKGVEDKRSIKPPDIIVFYEPNNRNKLIVHRVIQQIILDSRVEFITKGDNNPSSDYDYWKWRVRETDIVGIVIAKLPPVTGLIIIAIESQAMTMFTVTVIIVVIGVDFIYNKDEKEQGKTSL